MIDTAGKKIGALVRDGLLDGFEHLVTAKVRSNTFTPCPFGLTIPSACHTVGRGIGMMKDIAPNDNARAIDDKTKANSLAWKRYCKDEKHCAKCKYARSFMRAEDGSESVVCNFGEANEGVDSIDFTEGLGGYYPSTFQSGLFTVPSALGPEGRDSYMARSPGTSPWGWTTTNTPGL